MSEKIQLIVVTGFILLAQLGGINRMKDCEQFCESNKIVRKNKIIIFFYRRRVLYINVSKIKRGAFRKKKVMCTDVRISIIAFGLRYKR